MSIFSRGFRSGLFADDMRYSELGERLRSMLPWLGAGTVGAGLLLARPWEVTRPEISNTQHLRDFAEDQKFNLAGAAAGGAAGAPLGLPGVVGGAAVGWHSGGFAEKQLARLRPTPPPLPPARTQAPPRRPEPTYEDAVFITRNRLAGAPMRTALDAETTTQMNMPRGVDAETAQGRVQTEAPRATSWDWERPAQSKGSAARISKLSTDRANELSERASARRAATIHSALLSLRG